MGQQQGQMDPTAQMFMKTYLERENSLIAAQLNSQQPYKELFMTLIPTLKTNADPIDNFVK